MASAKADLVISLTSSDNASPEPPTLYRDDLQWHEKPIWYLITVAFCTMGGLSLSMGLLMLSRRPVVLWVMFLYSMGGLAFGAGLAVRYLNAIQYLWSTYRQAYRPLWRLPEGREVGLELFGGWFVAIMVGLRLGKEIAVTSWMLRAFPETQWIIGGFLGLQFGLWSGVTLIWPVYCWIKSLPERSG